MHRKLQYSKFTSWIMTSDFSDVMKCQQLSKIDEYNGDNTDNPLMDADWP